MSLSGDKNPRFKTGLKMSGHPHKGVYSSWQNMKSRCLNTKHPKYPRYGGRGINVCDEWLDITPFYSWALSSGWAPGLTIDRINYDLNYCPENCRWVSAADNSRRKSTTRLTKEDAAKIRELFSRGVPATLIAKQYKVVHGTIWFILHDYTHVPDGDCTLKLNKKREGN